MSLTPPTRANAEPIDAMKTKTLLIHLAAATLCLTAFAGNPHGGAPGKHGGFAPRDGNFSNSGDRGASAWAPGRSGNLPPGHGGTPPGQMKQQNRSFWGNLWGTPRYDTKKAPKTGLFGRSWF